MRRLYSDPSDVIGMLKAGVYEPHVWQELNLHAHLLLSAHQIDHLLALDNIPDQKIKVLPHQIRAVMTVMNRLGTRAILADEVGLGKTIEAGIIIKEYACRGLAQRVLILTPAPLTTQWHGELINKFGERFTIGNKDEDPDFEGFDRHERLIASIDTAKVAANAALLTAMPWDLIIIDEAHRLKNAKTLAYQFVQQLESRYMLLLTATPMQNHLTELFNLVNLLKEGALGSYDYYVDTFIADKTGRALKNAEELQARLRHVMVRHRRADVGLQFPRRDVHTIAFSASAPEMALHDGVVSYVARGLKASKEDSSRGSKTLTYLLLSRLMASSPKALAQTLDKMIDTAADKGDRKELTQLRKLAEVCEGSTKLEETRKLLKGLDEKALIFTSFHATQQQLAEELTADGYKVEIFHGGMSQKEKDAVIERFRGEGNILICTDAGSEGVNLQFCRVLINYDLPWNPMRVEQRIGRVHRLGQEADTVLVFNFSIKGTVEAYILEILYQKIALFSEAVGATDLILSNLKSGESFDKQILDVIARSAEGEKIEDGFALLGEALTMAKQAADQIQHFDQQTLSLMDLSALEEAIGQSDSPPSASPPSAN
ncbi:MAG: DEAD/DEAH box helicase [Candidatus Sericytochromatia bacterium]|nr:DEAD/DEAH box helicase [Candidatus Sericytochromatia bacterium]